MTEASVITLNTTRLERVRKQGEKIEARCPACAEHGGNPRGRHLVIWPDGRFSCSAHQGDKEHRRRIFELVGFKNIRTPDPARDHQWRENRERERRRECKRQAIRQSVTIHQEKILERYAWDPADVWESSPVRLEGPEADDPAGFLAALFSADSVVWTGEVWQSGERFTNRWRTVKEWSRSAADELGPMVTPCTWRPDTLSRTQANIESIPFLVLDFDGRPGHAPATGAEIFRHHIESLSVIRWLCKGLHWNLAAILDTGSKSLHAWFHDPGKAAIESLRDASRALGIDAGLIGHPEHPCRLPGQRHQKTGRISRVLWLDDQTRT